VGLPEARDHLSSLGRSLRWHGGLSADVVVGPDGPCFIDINPRLVEPANAYASGVDLAAALVAVARPTPAPRATRETMVVEVDRAGGTDTHQLLVAVLGAAARGRRGPIAAELLAAVTHRGAYAGSVEELSPIAHDPRAALPVLAAAVTTLVAPSAYSWFADGSVANYALTPTGWEAILAASLTTAAWGGLPGCDWPR
jgi:hypothetical protein